MSIITSEQLRKISKGKPRSSNVSSLALAINDYGADAGLDNRANLTHFLAQIMHESGGLVYDREIWGPTPAQKRYEGRKDLGNVQKGDGAKFRGYGPMQLTGRRNVTAFYKWCVKRGLNPPDFTKHPELIVTDPWEGLSAIWYWDAGNPTGSSLNKYAKDNNLYMITQRVNGGQNGANDRLNYYGRAALVLLGYEPTMGKKDSGLGKFQSDQKGSSGTVDGILGETSRMALHKALAGVNPFEKEIKVPVPVPKPVPVTDESLEKPFLKTIEGNKELVVGVGIPAVQAVGGVPWQAILATGAVLLIAGIVVWYMRNKRARDVAVRVERVEATAKQVEQEAGL